MWVQSLDQEDPLEKEQQPTPVFLPGNPMDREAWQDTVHEVAKELDTTERLNNSILQARASWCQERDSWRSFTPCNGKKERENPSKPVWTIAACATEDSHRPWTRVVSVVRPASRGPNAELFRVGLLWCLALSGARAATAPCSCQVPGSCFVLSILGQPLLL